MAEPKTGKNTAVTGICLFCTKYYPKTYKHQQFVSLKSSKIPKHRRCFSYLFSRLGIQEPKTNFSQVGNGFNFITETVPLCISCSEILDQLHVFYLKSQSIKHQLDGVVERIRKLILDSQRVDESTKLQVYSDSNEEKESHFSLFRRQVQPQPEGSREEVTEDNKPAIIKIELPEITLQKLTPEETNKYLRPVRNSSQTGAIDFDEIQDSQDPDSDVEAYFCVRDEEDENDMKPDINIIETSNSEYSGPPLLQLHSAVVTAPEPDADLPLLGYEIEVNTGQDAPIILNVTAANSEAEEPPVKRKAGGRSYQIPEGDNDCRHCDEKFQTQIELVSHYKSVHPSQFPRSCPEPGCEYQCYVRPYLRQHMILRHAPDSVREQLKSHCCSLCGKKFTGRKALEYHSRIHTGERPFQCQEPGCGRKFRQKQALDVHMFRIHENVRNFACPHCPWKFKDHVILRGHIAIHTGEKNHVCHICGAQKIHKHALTSHFKTHMKRGDWVEPPDYNVKKRWWKKRSQPNRSKTLPATTTSS